MSNEKPKWLKRLERESWQAELIVSGAAIIGSLQLPGLLNDLIEGALVLFSPSIYVGLYMLFIYLFFAVFVLIVSLVVHFVMRALWVGLIGLNSVFPQGISPESKSYPKSFMDKLVAEFPNDLKYVSDIDDFCSVIFAFCAYLVMTFLAIIIDVIVVLIIYMLFSGFLPEGASTFFLALIILFISISGFSIFIMNSKKLRDKPFVKKYQYPIYKLMSRVSLHVFRKPITRLSFTFISNLELKKYIKWVVALTIICSLMFFKQAMDSKLLYLANYEMMKSEYSRTDKELAENYENTRTEKHGRILSAVMSSNKISGQQLEVFVPVFRNESKVMDELCGEAEHPDGATLKEKREKARKFRLACLKNYHQFYLNDSLVRADIIRFAHPNKNENGIKAYISTTDLPEGINVLKIEKRKTEKEIYRTMQLHFIYSAE